MTTQKDISATLAHLVNQLSEQNNKGKEYMLSDVYSQVRRAYEQYPEDTVIRQVAFVVEKMFEKSASGTTITQADMSKMYNNFAHVQQESKFRKVLGHLLKETAPDTIKNDTFVKQMRIDSNGDPISNTSLVDQNATNILSALFDSSIQVKAYNETLADKGITYVKAELKSLGFDNSRVALAGGNAETLVYLANFDTVNGIVSVAIPIDLVNNNLVLPNSFIVDNSLRPLTAQNLQDFISKKATLHSKAGEHEEIRPVIETPVAEMPKELAHLAADFEDTIVEAASNFGTEAIKIGKQIVIRELTAAGFKNAQVKFGSESGDSVVYIAAIHTPKGVVDIEVPIEMKSVAGDKYVPLCPTYFAYDGILEDFSTVKLQRFAMNIPQASSGTMSFASMYKFMRLSELKDEIVKAASENDYVSCETVLNVIAERFDHETFKNAVADYHFLLMTKNRLESGEIRSCPNPIPAGKVSVLPYCPHVHSTIDKVAVDEHGHCRLKTALQREKMNPDFESGAAISTSKINLT